MRSAAMAASVSTLLESASISGCTVRQPRAIRSADGAGFRGNVVLTVEVPDRFVHLLERDEEFFETETEAWVFPLGVPPSWIKEAL